MGTITKIEIQKKNKSRASIFVDGRFCCGLLALTVLSHSLAVGQEVDLQWLESLQVESARDVAFDKALGYLGYRMRSEREIGEYLLGKGFDQPTIDSVMTALRDYRYVDDGEFCRQFIQSKANRYGSKRLRYELRQRGIDDQLIDQNLDDFDFSDALSQLIQKKLRTGYDHAKLTPYLLSCGYDYDQIATALEEFPPPPKEQRQKPQADMHALKALIRKKRRLGYEESKLSDFLWRKGFTYDDIKTALQQIEDEEQFD